MLYCVGFVSWHVPLDFIVLAEIVIRNAKVSFVSVCDEFAFFVFECCYEVFYCFWFC